MKKTKPLFYIALILIGMTAGVLTREATRYDFVTSDGRQYQWRELKQSWVVVNYFAPWCAPCLKEIPELNQFARTKPDEVRLFAINYDPADQQQVQALRQKYDIRFPVIVAGPETHLPMAPPPALPATFIIAPDGQVVKTLMGEISAKQLTATLAQLQQ
ncbi:TlpA family protein disulfide reductase [Salinimonas marina]|uniref:TlpA family protein disulfide reductase n=1 Tax=Salinimonas marina TaxID=2785918 RepID=A0A7S9DZN7_9ALTE|nr:TlpA disulfide reductase family protein [Salinimonas marina]QPG06884.1 TlpA family protein disulfide reductase [Salinimonas marina]